MITIIAKSFGEMTPSSKPMLSTISSISPRVFIKMPSDAERFQSRPVHRAATNEPPNFAERGHQDDHRREDPGFGAGDEADLRSHAGVREERRQQQDLHDVFQLVAEVERDVAVVRNDRAQEKRTEDRVDADPLRRERREQQRHEHPHRHPPRRLLLCADGPR